MTLPRRVNASPRLTLAPEDAMAYAEWFVCVADPTRVRLLHTVATHKQVTAAADEAGLWTSQTAIFPENRASIALHHSTGVRTIGLRERIARHHGGWHDTVMLERRAQDDPGTSNRAC